METQKSTTTAEEENYLRDDPLSQKALNKFRIGNEPGSEGTLPFISTIRTLVFDENGFVNPEADNFDDDIDMIGIIQNS